MIQQPLYPALKSLVDASSFPDSISEILGASIDRLFYKSYYAEKSVYGDTAYHKLILILNSKVGFTLFGGEDGLELLFNPGSIEGTTELPLSVYYSWPILKYTRSKKLQNLATAKDFFDLILNILQFPKEELFHVVIVTFFGGYEDPIVEFIDQFNQNPNNEDYNPLIVPDWYNLLDDLEGNMLTSGIDDVLEQLETNEVDIFNYVLLNHINEDDLIQAFENMSVLFDRLLGDLSLDNFRDLFIPKFSASLPELDLALAFPRTWLKPVDINGNIINGDLKSKLRYNVGGIEFSSTNGFRFLNADSFDFDRSLIANTGLILSFTNAKLDFSKTTNIPEADEAGYPVDFVGLYVKNATIEFSKFGQENPSGNSALIYANNLFVGTGGVSGTIGLDANGKLYRKFGNFAVELDAFSLTFRQNAIINSSISGKLIIPGFVKDGNPAEIAIQANIFDNGDFSITALPQNELLKITLPDVLELEIISLTLGKVEERHYIEVAAKLDFIADIPALGGQILPKKLDIYKLRIWDNGKLEFAGGSFPVPKAFKVKVGPVKIEVTNISFGPYKRTVGGVERGYNFFGFDGMINTGNAGVNATGNGFKYYFTTDGGTFDQFISIDGIGIDISIPGNVSKEKAAFLLNGYLSVKTPNPNFPNSKAGSEYTGSVTFNIPKLKLNGSAGMRLQPDIPAFIVDIGLELATAIPLGATGLGIYGFRGLIGQHYMPSKAATTPPLPDTATWWDYFKTPSIITQREGIEIDKFETKKGFSVGAGVSIATNFDSGKVFSSKLFLLLGLPDVFLIQGQAAILRERIGLQDDVDPPFSALIVIGDNSFRGNLGVNYNLPESGNAKGAILSLQGNLDLAFFFNNASGWYLNIGKETPETERVRAKVLTLFQGHAYLMMSSRGVKAGAGVKFDFNRGFKFVSVGFGAFLNMGGFVNFKPIQIGGYIQVGGYAYIKIVKIKLGLAVTATLAVEAPRPFNIKGGFELAIKIPLKTIRIRISLDWTFNNDNSALQAPIIILDKPNLQTGYLPAVAVNMLSNDTFTINFVNVNNPTNIPVPSNDAWFYSYNDEEATRKVTIPIDSYIDIELLKPVKPLNEVLGGSSNQSPNGYKELFPPQKGYNKQFKHEFELTAIDIYAWNSTISQWEPYQIYEAVTAIVDRNVGVNYVDLQKLKPGYWQFSEPNKYNKIRLMSQHMFSYTADSIAITDLDNSDFGEKDIFCFDQIRKENLINWKEVALNTSYLTPDFSYKNVSFNFDGLVLQVVSDAYYLTNSLSLIGLKGVLNMKFNENISYLKLLIGSNNNQVTITYYKTSFKRALFGRVFPLITKIGESTLELTQSNTSIVYENGVSPFDLVSFKFNTPLNLNYTGDLIIGGHVDFDINSIPAPYSPLLAFVEQDKSLIFVAFYNSSFTAQQIQTKSYLVNEPSVVVKWALNSSIDAVADINGIVTGNPGLEANYLLEDETVFEQTETFSFSGNDDALNIPYQNILTLENGSFSFEVTAIFNPFEAGISTLISKIVEDEETGYKKGYTLHLCQFTPAVSNALYATLANVPKYKIVLTIYDGANQSIIEAEDYYSFECDGSVAGKQYKNIFISVNRTSNQFDIYLDRLLKYTDVVPSTLSIYQDIEHATLLNQISYLTQEQYDRIEENTITEDKLIEEVQILDDSINKVYQPVWRPNTTYAVHVKTQDRVDGVATGIQNQIFGFKTAGTIGHFHQQNEKYRKLLEEDREAEFKLSGLKYYIDYERSYPDAQGRFDLSKPVYWADPKIKLFFIKDYINAIYNNWDTYKGNEAIESKLELELLDPFGNINTQTLAWQPEEEVVINNSNINSLPNELRNLYYLNVAASQGSCNAMPQIKKKIQRGEYAFGDLDPNKLYSAIFNSSYKVGTGELEKEEVHRYSFKTSRYANLEEQIQSFVFNQGLPNQSFSISFNELLISDTDVDQVLKKLINNDETDDPTEVLAYATKFDRLIFGGMKIKNLEPLNHSNITFIVIADAFDPDLKRILGFLYRSTEPINDPKLPKAILEDTVSAKITLSGGEIQQGNQFLYIHSKDTSSVFVTNAAMDMPRGVLEINFKYKVFNGLIYEVDQECQSIPMEILYYYV